MGAHKPTVLFLYTDLKKSAPPTRMSILKTNNFQIIAIFHILKYTKYLWEDSYIITILITFHQKIPYRVIHYLKSEELSIKK